MTTTETPTDALEAPDDPETQGQETHQETDQGAETFPKSYVEKLRTENAEYRTKAKRAEDLASRLLAATVRQATAGILADPTDLPASDDLYDEDGYPDPERIADTARELVARKPHLADRRPAGPVEQGPREQAKDVNLAGILRTLAG